MYCVIETAANTIHCVPLNENGEAYFDGKWQAPESIKGFLRLERTPCDRPTQGERR